MSCSQPLQPHHKNQATIDNAVIIFGGNRLSSIFGLVVDFASEIVI